MIVNDGYDEQVLVFTNSTTSCLEVKHDKISNLFKLTVGQKDFKS